jgi:hypothetical protein
MGTENREPQPERQGQEPGQRRDVEIDFYPPQQDYQWEPLDFLPEQAAAQLNSPLEHEDPGYSPQEILFPLGRIEEQYIVGLALTAALYDLSKTRRDEARLFGIRQFIIDQGERSNVGYAFLKHQTQTEEQYSRAREIFLEATNTHLEKINRKKIPPPGSQTPPQ